MAVERLAALSESDDVVEAAMALEDDGLLEPGEEALELTERGRSAWRAEFLAPDDP